MYAKSEWSAELSNLEVDFRGLTSSVLFHTVAELNCLPVNLKVEWILYYYSTTNDALVCHNVLETESTFHWTRVSLPLRCSLKRPVLNRWMYQRSRVHSASFQPTSPPCRSSGPVLSRFSVTMAPPPSTLVRLFTKCGSISRNHYSNEMNLTQQPTQCLPNVPFCSTCCTLADLADLLPCVLAGCVHAVSSGSVTVNADSSVQLLAEEAVPLDQLDVAVSIPRTACTNGWLS